MTPPQDCPPAPSQGSTDFARAFEAVFVNYGYYKETKRYATDNGLDPQDIVRYVEGTLSPDERADVQSLISQSPWAVKQVAALVKKRRNPA